MDLRILVGALMGWTLGANDTASVFGLPITTGVVRARTALWLTASFVIVGAGVMGYEGLNTYAALGPQTAATAFIVSLVPALLVWATATLGLPVSTTQAVVGAMTGLSLLQGEVNWPLLLQLGAAWLIAPVGALMFAALFYLTLGRLLARWLMRLSTYETLLKTGFVVVGAYGAFALGANNVANVSGVWVAAGVVTPTVGVWLGGVSIALGVLTYSHRVIETVGHKLTDLDPFSGFIAMLSSALVLHLYASVGFPVSASQAIVGAVIGIGLVKGARTIQHTTVIKIVLAWFAVPVISGLLAALLATVLG